MGFWAQVARGGAVASSTRDVGGGYAERKVVTAGTRGQREREESGRGRGESGRADGRARQGREGRGGRKARAGWA